MNDWSRFLSETDWSRAGVGILLDRVADMASGAAEEAIV